MKILVAGQSKTGTTALLSAIRAALGIETTYFEPDSLLDVKSYSDPMIVKRLVDDLRWTEPPAFKNFDRRFLTYRDPRDRFISWLLYDLYGRPEMLDDTAFEQWVGILRRKERRPRSVSVTTLTYHYWEITGVNLLEALGRTNDTLTGLVRNFGDQFTMVRYEDFVRGDVTAITAALGTDVPPVTMVSGPESRVARTKGSGSWRRWFLEDDVEVFRPFCAPILVELGYDDDWTFDRRPAITPAESSEYLRSLRATRLLQAPDA